MFFFFFCLLVTQLCLTLCDPMDCSLPGSSVHGILQARILEWLAIPFSKGSSRPRDRTWVLRIPGRFFTIVWATREALWCIKVFAERVEWFGRVFKIRNSKACLYTVANNQVERKIQQFGREVGGNLSKLSANCHYFFSESEVRRKW